MNLFNHPLFKTLQDLNFPTSEYAIWGSGPMWARGIRESADLDLIVTDKLWAELSTKPEIDRFEKYGLTVLKFSNGDIEILNDWAPGAWDLKALIRDADVIQGVRFVTLENVVKWKQLKGRDKDAVDIKLIEDYLEKNSSSKKIPLNKRLINTW